MRLTTLLFLVVMSIEAFANVECTCNEPFLQNFTDPSFQSIQLNWFDNSTDIIYYEVELVEKGNSPTGVATVSNITEKFYNYTGLESATEYTVYLRSICTTGESNWNGPYPFNTNIRNGQGCDISLGIDDNNCNKPDEFLIDVFGLMDVELGENLFIETVNLVIDHDWPADLKISLISPNGKDVLLIEHRGIGYNHLGNPDSLCLAPLAFNNQACLGIEETNLPLVGSFKPEGDINAFLDGSDPNGIWTLEICDQARDDIGTIRSVEIVFSQEVCPIPSEVVVKNTDADAVTLKWEAPFNCSFLNIEWGLEGFIPGTSSSFNVNCQNETYTLNGLLPDTNYDIYVRSLCILNDSPLSCPITIRTACNTITEQENFDQLSLCPSSCSMQCMISGNWTNETNDLVDDHDWIVQTGMTPSPQTGPERDPFLCGNYIYIENTVSSCSQGAEAILISKCLQVPEISDACTDMSFYYHMYGIDINRLVLEASLNNGINWNPLFMKTGDQSNNWERAEIDLSPYQGEQIVLRFRALSGARTQGDIAIDQIEFYGSTFVEDGSVYYVDNDGDGYGSQDSIIYCGNIPLGYSPTNDDCDDNNVDINPAALELPCNLIDENCNGNDDDPVQVNPVTYDIIQLNNETCLGAKNGALTISLSGGTLPYDIEWNNGMSGNFLTDLGKGVYFATITDGTGCISLTEFIEIDANASITYSFVSVLNPSCNGLEDGALNVNASGGNPPYSFNWSNGDGTGISMGLGNGGYDVTITDQDGCSVISDSIFLSSTSGINAGIQLKTEPLCHGDNNGSLWVAVINGTQPLSYIWSNGQTGERITDLAPDTYAVTITDGNGCIEILSDLEITQPDSLNIFLDGAENVRCFGEEDGRIEITVSGGTPDYSYSWSNGSNSPDLFDLPEGLYSLTVSDINGCSQVLENILIDSPDPIAISIDSIRHVDCPYSTDGFISLNVEGGTEDYLYFWNVPGENNQVIDSLGSGTYGLTLIDQFNCKVSFAPIVVDELNLPLEVDILKIMDNPCFGDSLGRLSATVESNRFPYDFNWDVGIQNIQNEKTDTIYNLANGNYQLTITDIEGCVGTSEMINISSPEILNYSVEQTENLSCFESSDGRISIEISGGTMPFSINWTGGYNGADIDNLPAGDYLFMLLDSLNCPLESTTITLSQPEPLSAILTIINDTNASGIGNIIVEADGGTPDYTYDWSSNANTLNENQASNLFTDTYLITITDQNECKLDTFAFVDNLVGLEEIKKDKIYLKSNPVNDFVHIETTLDLSNYTFTILSSDGKVIKANSPLINKSISVTHMQEGTYYMILSNAYKKAVLPFIVMR